MQLAGSKGVATCVFTVVPCPAAGKLKLYQDQQQQQQQQ
jgi:hypothetical protein